VNPAIKYGAGDERARTILTRTSNTVITLESIETKVADYEAELSKQGKLTEDTKQQIAGIREGFLSDLRQLISKNLRDTIDRAEELVGENDDLPD
jgi:uncharacterized protein YnzC (UPF0291/DUF896 family)